MELTTEQASALINELQEPIASIFEFAIYTGFRKENILDLRIESIRFHDLTQTGEVELVIKGGKNEVFPLSTSAVEVLKRNIGNRTEGHVFLNPQIGERFRTINKGFDRAVRKLGLTVNGTKFRFHDLRHVFATWLHKAGVSLDVVRPLLGHRDRETTDRYVTYNWLSYSDDLNAIPKINRNTKKETPKTLKSKSLLIKNGKNWQAVAKDNLSFMPKKAVNN
ncbi:site-specific integrase [candidate division KSB1 bacterium]